MSEQRPVAKSAERLLDEGAFVMTGGDPAINRRESFRYVERPDGGRSIRSRTEALDGGYRLECEFVYDADLQAVSARGAAIEGATGERITLERTGPETATLGIEKDRRRTTETLHAPPGTLIDIEPNVMPMWMMTQVAAPEARVEFQWIGRSLVRGSTLAGGRAELLPERTLTVDDAARAIPLRHRRFHEHLPAPGGGTFSMDFDLWLDEAGRLRVFRVDGHYFKVWGVREGEERLAALLRDRDAS